MQQIRGEHQSGHGVPWYRREALYHIYPLSFADSNGDGFGDLQGIINHLDYLAGGADSLGVGAIWLSPIYASPMIDWGYDVSDYTAINPLFGTMADFERLVDEVHRRGLKLLLDFVPNHTSDQHPWFAESRSSRQSPRRDWYIWANPKPDGSPPNNWLSHFGGSSWQYDAASGQYYLHSYLKEQPDLNWHNPAVRRVMLQVMKFWIDKGVDGFRTDAVDSLIKDAALRDDPPNPAYDPKVDPNPAHAQLRLHSAGQRGVNDVLDSFCDLLAAHDGAYLLSEVYVGIPGLHRLYQACEKHPLQAPFNFNLMTLPWGAESFRHFIEAYEASLAPEDWPNYVLGNHDRYRLASRVGEDRARLLGMLQLTLRGLPVIYYGEELGLKNAVISTTYRRDTWGLRMPDRGLARDEARGVMPWSAERGGGWTGKAPWMPLPPGGPKVSVEAQAEDEESSLSLYRRLLELRQEMPALTGGSYHSHDSSNQALLVYERVTRQQRVMMVLNFTDTAATWTVPSGVGQLLASTHEVAGGPAPRAATVRLKPYEGRVYEVREEKP